MIRRMIVRRTCSHEVAVGRIATVAENIVLDGEELREVSAIDERMCVM